jgi:hypothetical protein
MMRTSLFVVVVYLTCALGALKAQSSSKNAYSTPVEVEKPTFFNPTQFNGGESKGAIAKLYPGEDVVLCLYRIDDLVSAYFLLDSLKYFYTNHQSIELWQNTKERLFWDRQSEISPWSNVITSTHPSKKIEDLSRRFAKPEVLLENEIATQLNFCLGYLNVDHTDSLLLNNYLIPKFKIVEEILALNLPPRLKAWILANDIYNTCVVGLNGFPVVALQ